MVNQLVKLEFQRQRDREFRGHDAWVCFAEWFTTRFSCKASEGKQTPASNVSRKTNSISKTTTIPDSQYWVSFYFTLRRLDALFVILVYLKKTLRGRSLNLNAEFAILRVPTLHDSFEMKS